MFANNPMTHTEAVTQQAHAPALSYTVSIQPFVRLDAAHTPCTIGASAAAKTQI
jgi:hypothetical protein